MPLPRSEAPAPSRRPLAVRIAMTGGGFSLIALAPIVGILPGPGGIFFFAVGVALLLRGSNHAKRYYVHGKRRWPKLGSLLDRAMRRDSVRRRADRDRRHAAGPVAELSIPD